MSPLESANRQTSEMVAGRLLKILGTSKATFCFRTSSGSVYAADEHARTARYKTSENVYVKPSKITVFLDHKYLDPTQTDRGSEQYLPNSMVHQQGFLILIDKDGKPTHIQSWENLPDSADYETVKNGLQFVVFDSIQNKAIKKAPVSFAPKLGTHPIEFCDPNTHKQGHRNHFGDVIENVTVTNNATDEESRKALESMAKLSLK